jgi:predicted permease
MRELFRRLGYMLHRSRRERELESEMAFHREMAARHGGERFGNTLRLREEARDAWGWTWLDRLGQDLRYAARTLCRAPGFTMAAVATLAIGIGVNVTAFGFLNLVVLQPLPVRDPETLLRFERRAADRFATDLPYPEAAFIREHTRTLAAVLAMHRERLRIDAEPTPLSAHFVTENFFAELGAGAQLGRLLVPGVDDPGTEAVAVLSHHFWERRFSGDRTVVGRTLVLNGTPVTIAGVAVRGFGGLTFDDPDVWLPIASLPSFIQGSTLLTDFSPEGEGVKVWGRRRSELGAAIVEDELRTLVATLREQHPEDIWADERLISAPGGHASSGGGTSRGTGAPPSSKMPLAMGMAGALVLLILTAACANLGGLLLARGVARDREIAIRSAVGADAARLVRQLFTESLVLSTLGTAAGLFVGRLVLDGLMKMTGAPSWLDPRIDWRVAAFAVFLVLFTAVLFGLAPALQVARRRRRTTMLRQSLIAAQVAASCVLLVVAALLVRALDRVTSAPPGFEYERVVSVDFGLASRGYSAGRAAAHLDTVRGRLRALPGVESIGLASLAPLGGRKMVARLVVDGRPLDVHVNRVDPEFFQTMGIAIRRGRTFHPGEQGAMVVSESLARGMWPGQEALGQRFENHTVVGIAGSARQTALQDPEAVEGYFPTGADDWPALTLLVKAANRAEDLSVSIAGVARSIDPALMPEIRLLKTSFRDKVQQTELTALAVGLLGISALALACVGIVGLVAYSVAQRTKEIGIRMALGASGMQVVSAILGQLSRPVAAGLFIGLFAAAALSSVLRRELYGVSSLDPAAYLAAGTVFLVVVGLAALWPARRALAVDPLRALRCD